MRLIIQGISHNFLNLKDEKKKIKVEKLDLSKLEEKKFLK